MLDEAAWEWADMHEDSDPRRVARARRRTEMASLEVDNVQINRDVDAIYSPHDGGWYLQNFLTDKVSEQIYSTWKEALNAYRQGKVTWE